MGRTVLPLFLLASAWAQPSFEVASVKSAPCGETGGRYRFLPPGRFEAINAPLGSLIQGIYQIRAFQLVAAPEWAAILADGRCARYYIQAAAETGQGTTEAELREMVKILFAERFALTMHQAQQEMDVYALKQSKGGVKTKPSTESGLRSGGVALMDRGWIQGTEVRISSLMSALSNYSDRPIIDETGYTGTFDFRLTWTPDDALNQDPGCPASFTALQERYRMKPETWDCPSLTKALEEQMGLHLERKRAPIDVWVVDHVERPSDN